MIVFYFLNKKNIIPEDPVLFLLSCDFERVWKQLLKKSLSSSETINKEQSNLKYSSISLFFVFSFLFKKNYCF